MSIISERKQILEGIKNRIIKNNFVENVSAKRMTICNSCEDKGTKCVVPGTGPCCNICGCSLALKTRSLSTNCPAEKPKWNMVLTQEEEDELNNRFGE